MMMQESTASAVYTFSILFTYLIRDTSRFEARDVGIMITRGASKNTLLDILYGNGRSYARRSRVKTAATSRAVLSEIRYLA